MTMVSSRDERKTCVLLPTLRKSYYVAWRGVQLTPSKEAGVSQSEGQTSIGADVRSASAADWTVDDERGRQPQRWTVDGQGSSGPTTDDG